MFKFNDDICYLTKKLAEIVLFIYTVVYQIEFCPVPHLHFKNTGIPESFHRRVSLNLFLLHRRGIWAVAGLFPKTLCPLGLDFLLNAINLALCESSSDYCKECKYCYFKGSR